MSRNIGLEANGRSAANVLAPPRRTRVAQPVRLSPLAFCRRFAALFVAVLFVASCASSANDLTGALPGTTGTMAVVVDGLVGTASADITVSNSVGFHRAVTGSGSLSGLPTGQYTIVAAEIQVGGEHYIPNPASQTVVVTSTGVASVAVGYVLSSTPTTGSIDLTVAGLPAGASAALTLSGPGGYSQALTASQSISGLLPGSYTVAAATLTAGGVTFVAQPTSQVYTVSAGAVTTVTVSYAPIAAPPPSLGSLVVSVNGLPGGVDGDLTVTGPNGMVQSLGASQTLGNLTPGSYTVTAVDVTSGATSYTAQPTSQVITVSAGASAPAVVTYSAVVPTGPTVGAFTVAVSGLLPGTNGAVTVTGPDGFTQQLTTSQTLSGLTPGSYQVTASSVTSGGITWAPAPSSQQRTIVAGSTSSATVAYTAVDGGLSITMPGVPSGYTASVTVTGPNGYSRFFTASQQLTGLAPGSYTITATSISANGFTYSPTPSTQTRTVVAGGIAAASVGYGATDGALSVTISGAPTGSVTVNGPGGFAQLVTSSRTITGLAAGNYILVAASVSSGGTSYTPAPPSQSVAVVAGGTASASVSYTAVIPTPPSFGSLALTMTGLPGGASGSVTVHGPNGFTQFLTAGQTLSGLSLGSYTIDAGNVSVGGTTYTAAPATQTVTVNDGQTANAAVTYTAAAPAPPTTGALTLTLGGLPGGTSGNVLVSGPGGFSQTLAGSQTLSALTPGSYSVVASDVVSGSTTYHAATVSQSVSVAAGATATATVTYAAVIPPAPSVGDLAVITTGLPGGANGSVDVTGPSGFSQHLTGTQTLSSLTPGTYTVTASALWTAGATYVPAQGTVSRNVVAGSLVAANVAYGAVDGGLSLTMTGLPAGATATVTVTGPGYSATLPSSNSQLGLPPATYTLTAANVTVGGVTYAAAPVSITVTTGTVTNGTMTFGPATGTLAVTVNGTPGGTGCNVLITGPGGFSQLLTGTQSLPGLAPGNYTIAAASITAGGITYAPSPATQTRTVSVGGTATATVTYSSADAGLTLTVSGLPGGAAGSITLTGPAGYSQFFTGSQSLTGLTPGSYTLNAASVTVGGFVYSPAPGSQSITVTSGGTATAIVAYSASGGSLGITVSGLPGGTNASVAVAGPLGYSQLITASQSLTGLVPGTYTLTASNVTVGGATYGGAPASQSVTVTAGASNSASVGYSILLSGGFTVTVAGLPGGTPAAVTVSGPGGYSQAVTATQTLTALNIGGYTVAAGNVTSGGLTYAPSATSQVVTLSAGASAAATVTYGAVAGGSLALTVTGLPGGANAAVTVTGPAGFSQVVNATQTLTGLNAGSYTLTASNVSANGFTWAPTPASQTVTVTGGGTASATVAFAATSGALTLTESGLPGGVNGNVTVTGPAGFTQVVNATQTLSGLAAGNYTITAGNVTSGGTSYTAAPASQVVTVVAGSTATASVAFSASTGALTVTLSGLPGGVNGNVVVTGPGGYSQTLIGTQTLSGLTPGSYTVTVNNVSSSGTTYTCTFTAQNVTVTAGATAGLAVVYSGSGGGSTTFPAMTPGYHTRSMVVGGTTLNYQIFVPQGYDPANSYPVILSAHGSGEAGTNNSSQLGVGLGPYVTANAATFPAIVIFPQTPTNNLSAAPGIYTTALDSTLRLVHADSTRIYMTGVSLGGLNTWGVAYQRPTLFAAIAPVASAISVAQVGGATYAQGAANVASRLRDLPIWQWHGDQDGTFPIATYAYPVRDAFAVYGPPANYHFIIGAGRGHELEVNYQDPAFWAWLFAQHK